MNTINKNLNNQEKIYALKMLDNTYSYLIIKDRNDSKDFQQKYNKNDMSYNYRANFYYQIY